MHPKINILCRKQDVLSDGGPILLLGHLCVHQRESDFLDALYCDSGFLGAGERFGAEIYDNLVGIIPDRRLPTTKKNTYFFVVLVCLKHRHNCYAEVT